MANIIRKRKFEVGIHNRAVRSAVYSADKNKTGYSDDWAQTHYVEVMATDDTDARKAALRRYPAEKGFVVESVACVEPDE